MDNPNAEPNAEPNELHAALEKLELDKKQVKARKYLINKH
jgi:hypothetical protein